MWLGNQPCVIITDYSIIKEALLKDAAHYINRLENPMERQLRKGDYGIIQTSGELWSQQRRFELHVLRDFGLGKNIMEDKIMLEIVPLLRRIRTESSEGPIDVQSMLDASVGSVINNLLFGYNFNESNMDEFLTLKLKLTCQMQAFGKPGAIVLMMLPILRYLSYFKDQYKKDLHEYFRKQIEEHRETINYDIEENTDYVEAYLKEQKKHKDKDDCGGFPELQLLNTCSDLWIAGLETTSHTLYWGILYVLRSPEVLKKIHEELDEVIGSSRLIVGSDKQNLHFVNAVIAEVQTLSNLVPFNIPRVVDQDMMLGGFKIQKGTAVLPQISSVLYDENIFPDAYNFDPTRHLDPNGSFMKIEELIPFSMGRRSCLGEGLAKAELFLFLANIYHAFDFNPIDRLNLPGIGKKFGSVMKADNFKMHFKPRFD